LKQQKFKTEHIQIDKLQENNFNQKDEIMDQNFTIDENEVIDF
jgi:hypothetical protein